MKKYLKLMRVHHYMKNILVFAVLACSGQFFNLKKLGMCFAAFVAFSMASSVIYIINDIRDRDKDRNHPTKCKRPIAAGTVTVKNACILAGVLFVIALVCNFLFYNIWSTVILFLYIALNFAYSFGLKNVPIADVVILVSGFLIRVLYGAVVTEISVSSWLYLTVIALSFFLALGKRRNELKQLGGEDTRKVLKKYPLSFLDKNMWMSLALAIVFYALWSMDEKTLALYGSNYLVFTVPVVLVITMKYSLDIEGAYDGDPVEVFIHDKVLMILCALYFAFMFVILYLPR